jgi:hypothetical protein
LNNTTAGRSIDARPAVFLFGKTFANRQVFPAWQMRLDLRDSGWKTPISSGLLPSL